MRNKRQEDKEKGRQKWGVLGKATAIGDMGKEADAGTQDAGPHAGSTRQNISPQCWRWNPELCVCQAISCSYAPGPAGKRYLDERSTR